MSNFTRKTFLSLIILCSCAFTLQAQEKIKIQGVVKNEQGKGLSKASVLLFHEGSTDTLRTLTNEKGLFEFTAQPAIKTGIAVSYIGFNALARWYDYGMTSGDQTITDLVLTPGATTLEGVTVQASKVQIKEDTVSYKIDSTMFRKNDNVEEVIKKLPGVEVDKNGTITAQGQQVTKVKVNGKEFFGGDVTTATRQLNADMVDKIDIIDDYGDQAAFTGVKSGDATKTLNIQLKKDKNKGYFGNASLGAGTDERYTNSVTINRFNDAEQISLIGNMNNTNASTFNFGSMGAAMGGMARSIGATSMFGGNSGGLATTKSIGLNYRDQWTPKLSVNGSYSFTDKRTTTAKDIFRQNAEVFSSQSMSNDYTVTGNHRFAMNLEWKIDSFNYLKFSPTVNAASTESDYREDFTFLNGAKVRTQAGFTTDQTSSKTPNLAGTLLFNHRFDRKGRILSVNLTGGKSGTDGNDLYTNNATFYYAGGSRDTVSKQYINQDNNNHNYGASLSYIEPLNKRQNLEFNYSHNKQYTDIDRENFSVDNIGAKSYVDSLSNIYDNSYITNRFGVNFRNTQKKFNYTAGIAVQPATITSHSQTSGLNYTQHLVNYYPVIRFAYNFSRSRSFNINYNGSTKQPTYQQLQPAPDYSNPQYITIGNPDLKPEFNNNLSLRYNNFDFITGNVFFSNLSFAYTKDKIVNSLDYIYRDNDPSKGVVAQQTRYINSDGYFTGSAFYAFSKPFQNRKYVINYGGSLLYNNNVSFIEGDRNTGRNLIFGQRLFGTVNVKKWLETTAGVNFTLNDNSNTITKQLNQHITTIGISHTARFILPKDLTIAYDLDKSFNNGYASNVTANPLLINASIEKLVSKKYNASLKLNGYDLLDQNTNLSRSISGNAITDTRTNNLRRYVMLSLIFRFAKFKGTPPAQNMGMPAGHGGMQMRVGM